MFLTPLNFIVAPSSGSSNTTLVMAVVIFLHVFFENFVNAYGFPADGAVAAILIICCCGCMQSRFNFFNV